MSDQENKKEPLTKFKKNMNNTTRNRKYNKFVRYEHDGQSFILEMTNDLVIDLNVDSLAVNK